METQKQPLSRSGASPTRGELCWQWGMLVAMMAASFMVYMDSVFRQLDRLADPPTKEDLIAIGQLSEAHQEFVDRIRKELGVKGKVEVFMLPVLIEARGGSLKTVEGSWVISIEFGFWLLLDDMEQKALLAHELGHIIFWPPTCPTELFCQEGADLFAAMHTSPDATIGLLSKLADTAGDPKHLAELRSRIQSIEKLKPRP